MSASDGREDRYGPRQPAGVRDGLVAPAAASLRGGSADTAGGPVAPRAETDRARLLDRGWASMQRGDLQGAGAVYGAMVVARPDDVEALSNLAAVLNAAGRCDAAETCCRQAIALRPDWWAAWANLGSALHAQQRYPEAITAYATALRGAPDNHNAWTNLGLALTETGRTAEAMPMHDMAVSLAPDDADIRVNRAHAWLAAGDLPRGFAEYEWRWRAPATRPHGVPGAAWSGEDPAGRTLLLHAEGGFGDTLQFVRYAHLLAARGARVVLRVQAPLVRLLRRLPGVAAVVAEDEPLPAFDLQCPLMSLPNRFGSTLRTLPAQTPYLAPCARAAARWRARLRQLGQGPKVGVVWAGAARPDAPAVCAMDRRRSMPLAALAPLAATGGVRFVSLQMGPAAAAERPPGLDLFDPMSEMRDFDDTAALVAGLDLVLSVDTAVAHLAGALGRPVWLLERYNSCWRWLHGRQDTPWYPRMRLYRQPQPGDWDAVAALVAADLRGWAGQPSECLRGRRAGALTATMNTAPLESPAAPNSAAATPVA